MGKNEHEKKAQVYDEFVDHVHTKVRNRDNPSVTVRDFSLMPRSGVTHMSLILENVSKGTRELFSLVESFAPTTKLVMDEDISNGSAVYVAHVPFTESESHKKHHRHHHHHHDYDSDAPPQTSWVVAYGFGFMGLLLVGVWKTEWSQWQYFLGI